MLGKVNLAILAILGIILLSVYFQSNLKSVISYPPEAITYSYFLANNCKIAQPYYLSVYCEVPPGSSEVQEFSMTAPGDWLWKATTKSYKVEGFDSHIESFWCDNMVSGKLTVTDVSTGATVCSATESNLACNGKSLRHGNTYSFKIEAMLSLFSGQNCYVSVYGKRGYLYATGPNGIYRKLLPQTQNCHSNELLKDLELAYGSGTIKADTLGVTTVTLTPEQGSKQIPYYYMEVAPVQPDINPDGYMVQCDQTRKILLGYRRMPSLDNRCWVSPTADVEIAQGYDKSKPNYIKNFACSQSYCDLTYYSGWANYQCLPKVPTNQTCNCPSGFQCIKDSYGNYHCEEIPTSTIGKCCSIPEDCFTPYEMTRADGQDILATPVCDKVNRGNCPEGTGQCNKSEKLIECRFDITYPNNKCCYQDPKTGKRYLDDCYGSTIDCRTLGANVCCLGVQGYTNLPAPTGKVCCNADGNIITQGIGTALTKEECDARKTGIGLPNFLDMFKKLFGLDKLGEWLKKLGLPDFSSLIIIIILILVAVIIIKLISGGRSGGGTQIIIAR